MNRMKYIIIVLAFLCMTGCGQEKNIVLSDDMTDYEEQTDAPKENASEDKSEDALIYVYVCGHVNNPGVYALESTARICDALKQAGGVTEDANPIALKQAEHMTDGMTIYVPGMDEELEMTQSEYTAEDGLVNINCADRDTLMTVPGIGESKADAIISYREQNGNFAAIEDLMKIPGIKEGVFNKMKDYIKVSN